MTIGGRIYTAHLPHSNSVSTQSSVFTNSRGELEERVIVNVNGDVTVYTTINGVTTATDAQGNIRPDGGPFHIGSQPRFY
ncbi:unnamed protein product [Strongylus vulgaris]|uniref:Uncharacterized protein n=1 Tax=Strongylus vulgaris TaxID=40348 RepID=A0A3P7IL84_STRVU|nr:unnamed protein product [Strongylus vulgaris]